MNKSNAIQSLRPNAEWVLRGDDLEWLDKNQTQPTEAEIQAEVTRLQAEYDAQEYARKRATEYPNIADVIVALAEKEEGRPEMWDEITAKRQEIRNKYPK